MVSRPMIKGVPKSPDKTSSATRRVSVTKRPAKLKQDVILVVTVTTPRGVAS